MAFGRFDFIYDDRKRLPAVGATHLLLAHGIPHFLVGRVSLPAIDALDILHRPLLPLPLVFQQVRRDRANRHPSALFDHLFTGYLDQAALHLAAQAPLF
ncbi:MAG TPA: hypothetical protein VNI58_06465, partial [Mariprofundaceae bacterium]|nr:hypothetical protein [Mariprofundaceae bacterium]